MSDFVGGQAELERLAVIPKIRAKIGALSRPRSMS